MAPLTTDVGRYIFYDCGAYGLFTLESERFQPSHVGKRTSQFGDFYNSKRTPIVPEETAVWRELGEAITALTAAEGPITVLDVGAYIGTFCIPLALSAAAKGVNLNIISFEPGPTQDILDINIDLNGLSDRVTQRRQGISNCDGYVIYRFGAGGTIGGNLYYPSDAKLDEKIIPATTIDTVTADMPGPMLIKLDTQGHEAQIMQHARAEIARKRAIWQIEFLAWSSETDMGGETFISFLHREFHVFCEGTKITPEATPEFIKTVDAGKTRMADLLLIPKGAGFEGALLEALTT